MICAIARFAYEGCNRGNELSKANRRRQIIVDSDLQKRMVMAATWPPSVGMVAAIVLLGLFCNRIGGEALQAGVELRSLLLMFLATSVFMVASMGFVIWTAVRISHRVAGPTVNVSNTLRRVREGDRSARVHLRRFDFLQSLAGTLNEHLEWLESELPSTKQQEGETVGADRLEGHAVEATEAEQKPDTTTVSS